MKKTLYLQLTLIIICFGCAPDFLDVKPDKALVVPTELHHFQALIDNVNGVMSSGPGIQALATDDFVHPAQNLPNLPVVQRNSYLWTADIFEGQGALDWQMPYSAVFYANIALDGLTKMKRDAANQKAWDQIYASALFYRAFAIFQLADVFAAPYEQSTAQSLPGIPYRTTMDVNEIVGRGTLAETYQKITADLLEAEKLLSGTVTYISRPSKAAANAALARVYMNMREYENAEKHASAALAEHSDLLDYNTLTADAARPFANPYIQKNPEIIFYYSMQPYSMVTSSALTTVDTAVYNSYLNDDLRKSCFFRSRGSGNFSFKGNYTGGSVLFGGLVTDELYLIRAECYARQTKTSLALADLNRLLKTRFKTGSFVELTATDESILDLVLTERRKELYGRGARWSDLRRLNQEEGRAVTLRRDLDSEEILLAANDKRYVFPIPVDEISRSGIEQNPR